MYRRPSSRYSLLEDIRARRREVVVLVVSAVIVAIATNICASAIYTIVFEQAGMTWPRLWAIALSVALLAVTIGMIIAVLYRRQSTVPLTIEIAVPYVFDPHRFYVPGSEGYSASLEGVAPNSQRPRYLPADISRLRFADGLRLETGKPVLSVPPNFNGARQAVAPWHRHLVNCLILEALHSYGRDTLSRAPLHRDWHLPEAVDTFGKKQLPVSLQENPVVRALLRKHPEWRLKVPRGARLTCAETAVGHEWILRDRRFGELRITRFNGPTSLRYDHLLGHYLGCDLPIANRERFFVLVTSVEASATSSWILLPGSDKFHVWATGGLAFLERRLDWHYFLRRLSDRLSLDRVSFDQEVVSETSPTERLTALERRLKRLEAALQDGIATEAPRPVKPDTVSKPEDRA